MIKLKKNNYHQILLSQLFFDPIKRLPGRLSAMHFSCSRHAFPVREEVNRIQSIPSFPLSKKP